MSKKARSRSVKQLRYNWLRPSVIDNAATVNKQHIETTVGTWTTVMKRATLLAPAACTLSALRLRNQELAVAPTHMVESFQ